MSQPTRQTATEQRSGSDGGRWRPTAAEQFEAFEKFAFPADKQQPTAWVRVEYHAVCDDAGTEYTADATGIFMSMDREVLDSVATTVTASRLPWTVPMSDQGIPRQRD